MSSMGRTVAFVVEGREIHVGFDVLVKTCPFFDDFFQHDPSCERIVLCRAAYVAVDAVLQSFVTRDKKLLEALWNYKGTAKVPQLLSVLDVGMHFGVSHDVLQRTAEALAKRITPDNVIRVLRSCFRYYRSNNSDTQPHLRVLKEACRCALVTALRDEKNVADWKALQVQHGDTLAEFIPRSPVDALSSSRAPPLTESPHNVQELTEASLRLSELQRLAKDSPLEAETAEPEPLHESLRAALEVQQRAIEEAEVEHLATRRELGELRRLCTDATTEIEDNEDFVRQSQLYVRAAEEAVMDIDARLFSIAAASREPDVFRRSLLLFAESNERERLRLDAAIALEESRLRAVQQQVRAMETSIQSLNEDLNRTHITISEKKLTDVRLRNIIPR
ncbi:hypothetical protein DQ04_00591180 [Trypanosoma grayi]|uniref:hypothetical protein n=1 Tax=Trypanosoma grayi TaxID=71804 RepID=UPI0004F44882|nr:hypothetical protein DQ04_00591180 [Trypanosoma grayi]KEG14177.1 hypothetical protein DQ04_00591180 [Trypanosoma grayi]